MRLLAALLLVIAAAVHAAPSHPPTGADWQQEVPSPLRVDGYTLPPELEGIVEPGVLAGPGRPGKSFTRRQKQVVKQKNADNHDGKNVCENCDVGTLPAKKHEKGVTPPKNETHVDHVVPKAKGGPGEVDNGQVLCRDCNLKKGSKNP